MITVSDGSLKAMSPLEALTGGATSRDSAAPSEPIVTITPAALAELVKLRDEEPDADKLGLRLAIASAPGEDFRYDLSFDEYLTAALTDEVRTHDGLKVIIPGNDLELLQGATLDYNDNQGLVIRNPNRPAAPTVEGLTERRRPFGRDRSDDHRRGQPGTRGARWFRQLRRSRRSGHRLPDDGRRVPRLLDEQDDDARRCPDDAQRSHRRVFNE